MAIKLVGISHRTTSFELLARVTTAAESISAELSHSVDESVLVLTCNRAELWLSGSLGADVVADELVRRSRLAAEELLPCVYSLCGIDAVRHAMRVAAGLDSLIVGEVQILGQLRRALERAQRDGTAGPLLSRLFLAAVQAGRRARTETDISRHNASVCEAAAHVALAGMADPRAGLVLVVGTGEAAELAARALHRRGVGRLTLTGRTPAHAEEVANRLGATTVLWSDLRDAIAAADVVVSATNAPGPVIRSEDLGPRTDRPLALVDLAVPHDVELGTDGIPGVRRYDLDDLRSLVDAGLARRQAAVPEVEAIVEDEAERFWRWLESRRVVPVILELRAQILRVVHKETRAALERLGVECDVDGTADRLAERIATRVLHEPTLRLKAGAAQGGAATYVTTLRDLFALEGDEQA
ncbi:MAG: glutamyl-tRNA reductase [Solirubrobacteraceae bacterium]